MKMSYFDYTEVFFWGSNWQLPSIGLDNGMAPNRRQTIIWINVVPIHWRIYAGGGGGGAVGCGGVVVVVVVRWVVVVVVVGGGGGG